jgi:hypothetical protein
MILWRRTRAFVTWWLVTFVIGYAWTVAAGIGVALLASWGLVQGGVPAWWLLTLAVLGARATVRSLQRAVMRER